MKVLAFFAHPDDETMFAGGTLALLASRGAVVEYLCATRGEGGEIGEPPVCEVESLGIVREHELNCAVQALGGSSLTILGYKDPRVGTDEKLFPYTDDFELLAAQLAKIIRERDIDVVFTHGSNGEYGHAAHVLCHQAVLKALRGPDGPKSGISLYTVMASFPGHPLPRLLNRDDPADLVIDIGGFVDEKTRAALCHRTQHTLFVRRRSEELGRDVAVPEVVLAIEGIHQVKYSGDLSSYDPLSSLLSANLIRNW